MPKTPDDVQAVPAEAAVAKFASRPTRKPVKAVKPAMPLKPSKTAEAVGEAAAAVEAPPKPAKPVKPAGKPVVAATAAATAQPERGKDKLVRDSFTMPRADFALIDALKARALGFRHPVKKSELLRAGLQVLAALSDKALKAKLETLPQLKTGRPKKPG